MKQQDKSLLGFYLGQEVVIHPVHGKYTLDGFYSKGVFAKRNLTGNPEDEECEMFEFEDIQFEFKQVQKSLLNTYSDSIRFLRYKADEGYWVGEFDSNFLKVQP